MTVPVTVNRRGFCSFSLGPFFTALMPTVERLIDKNNSKGDFPEIGFKEVVLQKNLIESGVCVKDDFDSAIFISHSQCNRDNTIFKYDSDSPSRNPRNRNRGLR